MTDSILNSIKKLLNIEESNNDFDAELIININSVFMVLGQLGLHDKAFRITDATTKWDSYLKDSDDLDAVKSYIYLKVKLIFDPPLNSSVMEALKEQIRELEWRLNIQVEES